MRVRTLILTGLILGSGIAPAAAASPDDPGARLPKAGYVPITAGTRSYRPVEPLPWGQVNRRVMPKEAQPPEGEAQTAPGDGKDGPAPQPPARKN